MNIIDNSSNADFYADESLKEFADKVRKGIKWGAICPKCKSKVIDNCIGCITGEILVCNHKGTNIKIDDEGIPDDFSNIKWEEIK